MCVELFFSFVFVYVVRYLFRSFVLSLVMSVLMSVGSALFVCNVVLYVFLSSVRVCCVCLALFSYSSFLYLCMGVFNVCLMYVLRSFVLPIFMYFVSSVFWVCLCVSLLCYFVR